MTDENYVDGWFLNHPDIFGLAHRNGDLLKITNPPFVTIISCFRSFFCIREVCNRRYQVSPSLPGV